VEDRRRKTVQYSQDADMDVSRAEFRGEASIQEIERLVADAKERRLTL